MANREKVIRECNWAIDQILVNGFTTLMTKGFFRDVITLLKAQPEVIRCNDCKHRGSVYCPFYRRYQGEKYDDWYCADGEQKEVK